MSIRDVEGKTKMKQEQLLRQMKDERGRNSTHRTSVREREGKQGRREDGGRSSERVCHWQGAQRMGGWDQ